MPGREPVPAKDRRLVLAELRTFLEDLGDGIAGKPAAGCKAVDRAEPDVQNAVVDLALHLSLHLSGHPLRAGADRR